MRIRLVTTLSFWLLGAVALSVLAMGSVTAWNLRQGFGAYLEARDAERLDTFAQVVADHLARSGERPAPGARPPRLQALLFELAQREGVLPQDAPPLRDDRLPPPGPQATVDLRPPRPPPPPAPPPSPPHPPEETFGARVALLDAQRHPWAGPPANGGQRWVERPVRVDGAVVAWARLRLLARTPDAVEAGFLQSQYVALGTVAAVLLVMAAAGAWWLARQWVRPLAAVQGATARIARGELDVRLPLVRSDEIGDVVRNINQMAESLQRIEGARRRWMADLSHELRTPLATLRGEIEALADGVRPLTREAVLSLREEALRLGALVDDLHLLAMADLQSLPSHFADADAVALVEGALRRFGHRAAQAGLTLGWAGGQAPAGMPVRWDAARIEQLLANLLENSLRYTDAPGRIELALHRDGARVRLSVADSAPGVAAADLPRLFEPLYRGDRARSRHDGGSGLGLAICEAIVRAHGGQISASASALGGVQIDIVLPADAGASMAG